MRAAGENQVQAAQFQLARQSQELGGYIAKTELLADERDRAARQAADSTHQSAELGSETLFPASLFTSAKLVDANGAELGSSVEAMLGCRSGSPAYLVVAEGGVAGFGETLRRVEWRDASVDGDRLVTKLTPAAFAAADRLTKDQWPGR